jgi:cytochrome c-type biogenesis protein CcmH
MKSLSATVSRRHPPRVRGRIRLTLALYLLTAPALAVQPDEVLKDPQLESRARDLSTGLRCMVCQNQSIDESDAPLAKDLRVLIRERLAAGDTDAEVTDFVVARYGDYVLLKPRLKAGTLVLWLTPFLIVAAGLILFVKRRTTAATAIEAPLTDAEQRQFDKLR